jgi:hypothetical protein
MSGETIFMATGRRSSSNARTASWLVCASECLGNRNPYASRMERLSSSPSVFLPASRAARNAARASSRRIPAGSEESGGTPPWMLRYRSMACSDRTALSGTG